METALTLAFRPSSATDIFEVATILKIAPGILSSFGTRHDEGRSGAPQGTDQPVHKRLIFCMELPHSQDRVRISLHLIRGRPVLVHAIPHVSWRSREKVKQRIVRELMKFQRICLPYLIIVAVVMSIYSVFLVHLTKSPFGPSTPTVRIFELHLNHGIVFAWKNIRCTYVLLSVGILRRLECCLENTVSPLLYSKLETSQIV